MSLIFLSLFSLFVWAEEPANQGEPTPQEEVEPLVKQPKLLEYVQAPYPEQAKKEGREGKVMLLIQIDEAGDVSFVKVIKSAGADFDQAATAAAWQFVFSPAEDKNGPVGVQIEFEYGFVLDASKVEGAVEDKKAADEKPKLVNLEGTLLELGTRKPLADFPINLTLSDGSQQSTTTDDKGYYAFRGLPAGKHRISSVYPEYQKAERMIEVQADKVTTLKLWIRNLNYREDELVGIYRKPSADVSRRTISMEEARRIPGTFGDPVRVIQNLPGAARSPFGTGFLVIRGANPQDSGVYVDGIRIPLIYHLGGYVSVLNADLVDSVDYLPGSYGVHYGRSLGGVIDVKTKKDFPERNKISWSTDLLDSGGLYQGRFGDYGLAVAGRRSYIDLLIPAFTKNSSIVIKPRWYDYQLKVTQLNKKDSKLSFFLFGFEDKLLFGTADDVAQGPDADFQDDINSVYASHRLTVLWEKNISKNWTVRLTPSAGFDRTYFDIGGGFKVDLVQSLLELRAESDWKLGKSVTLTSGLDWLGGNYNFDLEIPFSFEYAASFDPLAEREPQLLHGEGYAISPDLYLYAAIRPLKDKERWVLYPGIRTSMLYLEDVNNNEEPLFEDVAWDPRFSTKFRLFDKTLLKGGLGVYTQPPQPFELWRRKGTSNLIFSKAYSAEVGVEQQFTESLQADVSVFGKYLDDLIVQNREAETSDDLFFINEGIGRIYGMEFILRQAPVGRMFGWISYTLSRSERNDYPDKTEADDIDDIPGSPSTGEWYTFNLDQTHILVMVLGYQFPKDLGISGKLQYVTGNPYTPLSGGVYDADQDQYFAFPSNDFNSQRLPPFFTVDLRVDKLFTFKKWQLETYVDMLNTIRGTNPESINYNYDYTENNYVRGLPFIPSIGFEADVYF